MQRVGLDRELLAGPKHDLVVALDVEVHAAAPAAERLLLARLAVDRRVAVLGAELAREEHELLRADAVGVDVDDDLQADLLEPAEAEVGDLDRGPLGGRQDDAGVARAYAAARSRASSSVTA